MSGKSPKKSLKPKQRTNWKQRALHCEEVIGVLQARLAEIHRELRKAKNRAAHCEYVIGVQNQVAKAAEVRLNRYVAAAAEATTRAESAEKRLAEFKRSEYFVSNACVECGSKREEKYMNYVCYSAKCLRACADKLDPIRTHWQRFKSWLGVWKVAVLCVLFVLCCVAAFAAFVWKQGG